MRKKIIKIAGIILLCIVLLSAVAIAIVYSKQDEIVQELLAKANADFVGKVEMVPSFSNISALHVKTSYTE